MNWYPWLNQAYRQLVNMYQEGRGHHAILLHASQGMGADALSYGLSRWLMCQNKQGSKSCNECHSCRLMLAETHPDWHILQNEKGKSSIGIEAVRKVTEKLEHHAQQGGSRVVWIKEVEALTEAAANALLKTLEEPPVNCYFLLNCQQPEILLATLRSRCFYYHLAPPEMNYAIHWLQQQLPNMAYADGVTALNLSQGAPVLALSLLKQEWQEREAFCQALYVSLQQRNLYGLLAQFNQDNAERKIYWLLSLLLDALKRQTHAEVYCVNQDKQPLIMALSQLPSAMLLAVSESWKQCRHQLVTIPAINKELLLAEQLLDWEAQLVALGK
ncbi:TPA: DNA polymerase III subunit delta' [Proteus mirabilis]|uniref:DNA polymerase III subunit delta' n=1 Tax=Proteus TaxID=583 RepID=UPI00066668FA|nr:MULTISPECIES: DNA polymerase III subunit delta' [Proteus]EGT3589841.1 DNA polymerase III subunit delta' [Proteus mirabilis]ELL8907828.1 DNA polymerase III subunit delta' [Proteus mirabilis]EMA4721080.1 DNA polymerase III subunit delta' [Proteus mirabilis]KAB7722140.1 DNA polymerase III subunit delta' [Proteus mirabilis]MBF8452649.1 DNA polymerase III subunit delta' [Proteus mirabilis]